MDNNFISIVKYGTYYFPANEHYGGQGYVTCDRCAKNKLNACIGYDSEDLCLNCVTVITNSISDFNVPTPNLPLPFRPLTRMMQKKYIHDNEKMTFMAQNMYKPENSNKLNKPNNSENYLTYMQQDMFDPSDSFSEF